MRDHPFDDTPRWWQAEAPRWLGEPLQSERLMQAAYLSYHSPWTQSR